MPPSATATIEKLQSAYGPQAQAAAHTLAAIYISNLTWLEIISVLFSAACFAAAVYFLMKTGWVRLRIDRIQDVILQKDSTKKRMLSSWNDIERHFFAGDDNDLRIALIEADTLLDEALRGNGVQGAQLGDRLKKVRPDQLPNIEDVWQAHKLRNRIAHEANFVLKRDLAERALTVYETALKNLGFLEADEEVIAPSTKK